MTLPRLTGPLLPRDRDERRQSGQCSRYSLPCDVLRLAACRCWVLCLELDSHTFDIISSDKRHFNISYYEKYKNGFVITIRI